MHLITWMESFPGPVLFLMILILICCLSKGADILVDEAVSFSGRFRISQLLVGLFVISIGTTIPEAVVSIFAAVSGHPELALGNAVGSIICNTGLIMGLVTLFSPIATDSHSIKRQGWFQFAAGFLLVVSCIPFLTLDHMFETRVLLPRRMGIVFLMLLFATCGRHFTGQKRSKSSHWKIGSRVKTYLYRYSGVQTHVWMRSGGCRIPLSDSGCPDLSGSDESAPGCHQCDNGGLWHITAGTGDFFESG